MESHGWWVCHLLILAMALAMAILAMLAVSGLSGEVVEAFWL